MSQAEEYKGHILTHETYTATTAKSGNVPRSLYKCSRCGGSWKRVQPRTECKPKPFEEVPPLTGGWDWIHNSPKWHYFRSAGQSLCGRYMVFVLKDAQQGNDNSPDNCTGCKNALAVWKDKLAKQATVSAT